ncbi:MAG: amidohydrolase family protein [Verrucomicrobiota bacterium]|nr:amidohydrolase family protein [Limisphaera sp.]MDW8381068.1 amidohydrolase family protein [Verrucomicrobiota bacterium]
MFVRWQVLLWAGCLTPWVGNATEIVPPGLPPERPILRALVGGRVVVRPGEVLEPGIVVVRDGWIEAVGRDLEIPIGAEVWRMDGLTIYPGFIESLYVPMRTNPFVDTRMTEPVAVGGWTAGGYQFLGAPGHGVDRGVKGPGHAVGRVLPQRRAVENLVDPEDPGWAALRELGFTAAVVAPAEGIFRGQSALVLLGRDDPNRLILRPAVFQHVAFETARGGRARQEFPSSLMGVLAVCRQTLLEALHYREERAWAQTNPAIAAHLEYNPAWEALWPLWEGTQRMVIEPGSMLMADRAIRLASEFGLTPLLVACGEEWRRPDFWRGCRAGWIVPVAFPELPRLPTEEDWEQVSLDNLRAWDWAPENPAVLRQSGCEVAFTTHGLRDRKLFRKNLKLALARGLTEEDALAALTLVPARWCGVESWLGTIERGRLANFTVVAGGSYFDPAATIRQVWIRGRVYRLSADLETGLAQVSKAPDAAARDREAEEARQADRVRRIARSPLDDVGVLRSPTALKLVNATLWTCSAAGVIPSGQMLIRDGRILAVGRSVPGDPDAEVLDAAGCHVTPGLIDAHSHTAILGAVNEATLPSTAMVRIEDVINSESLTLREQLAGGLTVCHLLHGSANPIGGQSCVIKLRVGAGPEQIRMAGAPLGIKMALGENVKQSNWGDRFTNRFPQTRMGVSAFLANRLAAAREYRRAQEEARRRGVPPPRPDLELEALAEVLEGKRRVHCHAYRQDEIVAFLDLMEAFGVRVASLEHGLEGYKVADEIAAHGAGVATFADWWAYKFEVYDAIPHAGALMHRRGVVVAFKSDSSDLARRLNMEAAKAVQFGGLSEEEALRLVTLHPAQLLGIHDRVGSLEPGKDADFVLWSHAPLDSRAVCLQTWIDGKLYFERETARKRAAMLAEERAALLAKARRLATGSKDGLDEDHEAAQAFFRVCLERLDRDRHCEDVQP